MAVTFEQEHRHAEKITMTFQIRLAIRSSKIGRCHLTRLSEFHRQDKERVKGEHVPTHHLQSAGFTLGAVGSQKMKRWEADYVLEELDKLHLFDEYIEMSESKC